MIMAWLWNSMVPEISDTCMFLNSAKAIWIAIEKTYSNFIELPEVQPTCGSVHCCTPFVVHQSHCQTFAGAVARPS